MAEGVAAAAAAACSGLSPKRTWADLTGARTTWGAEDEDEAGGEGMGAGEFESVLGVSRGLKAVSQPSLEPIESVGLGRVADMRNESSSSLTCTRSSDELRDAGEDSPECGALGRASASCVGGEADADCATWKRAGDEDSVELSIQDPERKREGERRTGEEEKDSGKRMCCGYCVRERA